MTQRWTVPLCDVVFGEDEKAAVARVLDSGWVTMGPEVEAFEREFAAALGVPHAVAVSSGTAALHLALCAAGIGPGDEAVCPSLTFVATANAILYAGATPRFADIASPDDLTIAPEAARAAVNERTRAMVVMHYGGYPCDVDAIEAIAREHRLVLIEDAAHAPLAAHAGRRLGTIGDLGCFSFFSNKNLTCAEGGMIATSSDEYAARLRRLRSHGMTAPTAARHAGRARTYDVIDLGYNYRLDELRAAIGRVQLAKLAARNARRREIVERYRRDLSAVEEIAIPFREARGDYAYHLFPILVRGDAAGRDRFRAAIEQQGIETSIHYPPVHLTTYYRENVPTARVGLPVTEDAASRLVTLPLYAHLSTDDQQRVVEAVTAAAERL